MIWLVVDTFAAFIYFTRGIYLVGVEYIIFGMIAVTDVSGIQGRMLNETGSCYRKIYAFAQGA